MVLEEIAAQVAKKIYDDLDTAISNALKRAGVENPFEAAAGGRLTKTQWCGSDTAEYRLDGIPILRFSGPYSPRTEQDGDARVLRLSYNLVVLV